MGLPDFIRRHRRWSMIWQPFSIRQRLARPLFWLTRRTYSWNKKRYILPYKLARILLLRYGNNCVQQCLRRYIQPLLMLYCMAGIRRQSRWVVLKPITAKRKKCPSAALKIQNNRKNAVFLKNQAMNIAVCILFLMNTAIVLKRSYIQPVNSRVGSKADVRNELPLRAAGSVPPWSWNCVCQHRRRRPDGGLEKQGMANFLSGGSLRKLRLI